MNSLTRLERASGPLAEAYRSASSLARRRAALMGCERAFELSGGATQETEYIFACLRAASPVSAYLRLVLLDHECTWDDEGYYLGEVEGSAEGLLRDRRARAYAALVALVADDAEPDESIAHALFAVEDPRALVALLLPVLVGEATSA